MDKNFSPIISKKVEDTEAFAEQLARKLPRGSVVALHGDLGAGKTVFARGFARGLGIKGAVSSPTYTIVQEYRLPGNDGYLYHLDLYRISDERAALGFGIEEFLEDRHSVVLLEWPERIPGLLNDDVLHILITHVDSETRRISPWDGIFREEHV